MKDSELKKAKKILENCPLGLEELNNFLESGHVLFFNNNDKKIEKEIDKSFLVVKHYFPLHLHSSLLYFLGELSDNISQHSKYSNGALVLSYDKESKIGEILVVDDGASIPGVFEQNSIAFKDDAEAIGIAMKGKSTKIEEGRGFGLPSTKKLVEKGLKGKLVIASRDGAYKSDEEFSRFPKSFKGTVIYVKFKNSGESLNIYEYLE
ncbi:MAG: ATP-binding protein [archaeon]